MLAHRHARLDVRRTDRAPSGVIPWREHLRPTFRCAVHATVSSAARSRSCRRGAARFTETRRASIDTHVSMYAHSIRCRVARVGGEFVSAAARSTADAPKSSEHARALVPVRSTHGLSAARALHVAHQAAHSSAHSWARTTSTRRGNMRRTDRAPRDAEPASREAALCQLFTASRAASSAVANAAWKLSPPIGPCRSRSSPQTYKPA